jgi:hypothetical protein
MQLSVFTVSTRNCISTSRNADNEERAWNWRRVTKNGNTAKRRFFQLNENKWCIKLRVTIRGQPFKDLQRRQKLTKSAISNLILFSGAGIVWKKPALSVTCPLCQHLQAGSQSTLNHLGKKQHKINKKTEVYFTVVIPPNKRLEFYDYQIRFNVLVSKYLVTHLYGSLFYLTTIGCHFPSDHFSVKLTAKRCWMRYVLVSHLRY